MFVTNYHHKTGPLEPWSHASAQLFQTYDCCSGQFAGVTGQNFASAALGISHFRPWWFPSVCLLGKSQVSLQ